MNMSAVLIPLTCQSNANTCNPNHAHNFSTISEKYGFRET